MWELIFGKPEKVREGILNLEKTKKKKLMVTEEKKQKTIDEEKSKGWELIDELYLEIKDVEVQGNLTVYTNNTWRF